MVDAETTHRAQQHISSFLGVSPKADPYVAIYKASLHDRVELIEKGVLPDVARLMFSLPGLSNQVLFRSLRISPVRFRKSERGVEPLETDLAEKVVNILCLIGQVRANLDAISDEKENGGPEIADAWLANWLQRDVPALKHKKPYDLLGTSEGRHLVAATIDKLFAGVYL